MNPGKAIQNKINGVKQNFADYKKLDSKDKKTYWKEFLLNNALYILLIVAIIYTYIQNSNFLSAASIVNIISLSAANLPIACGIAGCIVLTGTDLSAGRVVGLTACITASLMQSVTYATKMFPNLPVLPIPLVILIVLLVGGIVGWVNGFFVAKFQLHPFIVTLATQLIVYGLLLMYIMINGNNGQPLSGLDQHFNDVVKGSVVSFNAGGARIAIPNYVWLAAVIVIIMWFIWNKTTFGKNMFAVGSNPEAAKVSGVNVMRTTILVHTLAGAMYGLIGVLIVVIVGMIIFFAVRGGFNIVYDTDGGSEVPAQKIRYGEFITEPETPYKPGYTFDGWYTEKEGETVLWYFQSEKVTGDMTLTAHWIPAQLTVKFDYDGGTDADGAVTESKQVTFGETYGTLPEPVKEGRTFAGWEYSGQTITADTVVQMTGEHVLTAIWK